MRAPRTSIALVGLFTLLAGITWVEGDAGQGLAGRVAVPDVFGVLIVAYAAVQLLSRSGGRISVPSQYRFYVPLLVLYLISASFSLQPTRAMFEILVHVFIFVVSLAIYSLLLRQSEDNLSRTFEAALYGAGIIAFIGITHFFFFPSMFSGSQGGLSGTFRNTGQAGSYFGLMLALLIPAYLCGFLRANVRNTALLLVIAIALLFTFKRAALVGVLFGAVVLFGRLVVMGGRRQKLIAAIILVAIAPVFFGVSVLLEYAAENIHGVSYRLNRKMTGDALDDFASGFFTENLRASIEAVKMRPFVGIGLSNASGLVTERYEIHGSFFAVLAYSGIIGLAVYLTFLARVMWVVVSGSGLENRCAKYLYYFWPFFIGLIGSWIYTYPLRKREFWIMLAIVSVVVAFARESRQYSKRRGERGMIGNPRLGGADVHR